MWGRYEGGIMKKVETKRFHEKSSCNRCGMKKNDIVKVIDSMEVACTISECETKCASCGFEDYWAYGYFQSGAYGYDSATRY